MGTCPTDAELAAYLENRLGDADDAAVAAHLAVCAACVSRLRELEEARRRPPPTAEVVRRLNRLVIRGRAVSSDDRPQIDGYEILDEVGRGGMGVVYKAHHPRFGVVALKIIASGARAGPKEVARFQAEAEAAKAMSDRADAATGPRSAVVRVYEIGESHGVLFICMELAAGESAKDYIPDFMRAPREAARVMAAVAEAVDMMHRDDRYHRDLKLDNILLQLRPGEALPEHGNPPLSILDPLVADYGLAKRLGERGNTKPEDLLGTPDHLAPEQVNDGKVANPRTDIYALGVSLYHMLNGTVPFAGHSLHDLLNRIRVGHASWPTSRVAAVPRELRAICLKCLEREATRRYATASELAEDLRCFLNPSPAAPVRARLPGLARRAARGCRKHPVAVALFGFLTLAVLLLAALAAAMWFRLDAADKTLAAANDRANLGKERLARAEEAARHQHQVAHAAAVHAAQTAARRGDWTTALRDYQHAIDDHFLDDERRLRVERLFGFFAVNDEATLTAELDDLERQGDLGPLAAQVSLVRGAWLCCDSARMEEGRAALRRALAARNDLLSVADALYAEALIETRPLPMIQALRKAVAADPLHYTAQASLTTALLASGQPDEAVAQADQMAGLFPDSPVPPYVRALARMLHGDRKAMNEELDRMAARMKSDLGPVRRFTDALADIVDLFAKLDDDPNNPKNLWFWWKLGGLIANLRAEAPAAAKPLAFAIPSSGLLTQWTAELFAAYLESPVGGGDVPPHLAQLGRDSPEALVQSLIMANRLTAAYRAFKTNRPADARLAFDEASRQAFVAAASPTLLVRSPITYQARFVGMTADVVLLKLNPGDEDKRFQRVWDNLHRLMAEGRPWPAFRRQLIALFLDMLISSAPAEMEADWKADTPAGAEALRRRNARLEQIALALLADWENEEPTNASISVWRRGVHTWAEGRAAPPGPTELMPKAP